MSNDKPAKKADQGNWYPANNGTEEPTQYRTGAVLLWCYQPSTGKHAYLNCQTDLILDFEEAQMLRGNI